MSFDGYRHLIEDADEQAAAAQPSPPTTSPTYADEVWTSFLALGNSPERPPRQTMFLVSGDDAYPLPQQPFNANNPTMCQIDPPRLQSYEVGQSLEIKGASGSIALCPEGSGFPVRLWSATIPDGVEWRFINAGIANNWGWWDSTARFTVNVKDEIDGWRTFGRQGQAVLELCDVVMREPERSSPT